MESRMIVDKLEVLYPDPSLHLEAKAHDEILPALGKAVNAARPMILAAVWRNVLREPSASFFAEDRRQRFGKTLDQLEQDDGGDKGWAAAQKALECLRLEMKQHKNDDGPFLLGSRVSYGDFLITAIFTWLERADSRVFERFVGYDESFRRVYEACRPWLERDGH
jgi:glutathione S-transferase